jgi:hypothetical protein
LRRNPCKRRERLKFVRRKLLIPEIIARNVFFLAKTALSNMLGTKKARPAGLYELVDFWGERLLAAAFRRDKLAVSTDDSAGDRIIDTSTGVANESADDLPEFLITQKTGAGPAKHAICFLNIRHATLLS